LRSFYVTAVGYTVARVTIEESSDSPGRFRNNCLAFRRGNRGESDLRSRGKEKAGISPGERLAGGREAGRNVDNNRALGVEQSVALCRGEKLLTPLRDIYIGAHADRLDLTRFISTVTPGRPEISSSIGASRTVEGLLMGFRKRGRFRRK
jgi:hypothetical protein